MPWINYSFPDNSTAATHIKNADRVKFDVSFDPNINIQVNTFDLRLVKYRWNGTYVDTIQLKDELIFCSGKVNDGEDFRSFGKNIIHDCYIDLAKFLDRNEEMFFYEIYLYDSQAGNFVDVPVLIDNIQNENGQQSKILKYDGNVTPPKMNNETIMDNWRLVRRFFLFDNLSGISGNSLDSSFTPSFITYAKTIKFVVELQNNSQGSKIYVPYLEIFYSTRATEDIVQNKKPQAYVSFISQYQMDIKKFMNVMLGLFIAINVVVVFIVIYRMYVWVKVNPKELAPDNYFFYFICTCFFKLCKFWGIFNFWFTFIISAYWYFFYKLQYRVYLLLPPLTEYSKYYKKFDIVFGVACGVYIAFMFYRIYCQVSFDIFFIDWEHDKEIFSNTLATSETETELKTKYLRYRGAWRLLHVANQFNALQSKRCISVFFCFCWFILFYYRISWVNRELHVPRKNFVEYAPSNYLIRHFLASVIVMGAGVIQFVLVRLLQLWLPLKKTEFLDLCSVANISVFLLDEMLHGYYIHGQSPFGKADSNLDELLRFLEEEGKGKIRGRGVSEEQEDLQCYEMYLSYKMRSTYDGLYYLQTEAMLAQNNQIDRVVNRNRLGMIFQYFSEKGIELNKLNTYMNNQLKNKIENISSNNQAYIKEKSFLERVLDFPPNNISFTDNNTQDILLFKDPNANFDDVLFSGMEWDWFLMDMFLFQMWTLALKNCEIAIFLTFLCDQILYYIRVFLGEKNVSKKAVIDNRFFS